MSARSGWGSARTRKIDGDSVDTFWRAGWFPDAEKPTAFDFRYLGPSLEGMTRTDGTQIWRNPRPDG
jgi:hypothetical protein